VRIAIWPVDHGGCAHYRQIFPARALAWHGADVWIDVVGPKIFFDRPWDGPEPGAEVKVLGLAEDYAADVVVMQRPALRHRVDLIEPLRRQGVRVVVDVDDRFDAIPAGNVAAGGYRQEHVNPEQVERACKAADVVTCSTPALARRYGFGKARVLPNLVPVWYLGQRADKTPLSVGWAGMVETHPGDLEVTGGGVQAALRRAADWRFCVVGSGYGVRRALGLDAEPLVSGFVAFHNYPKAVAALEVGIVPLRDSPFNAAKSCLKAAEMAALGVPVVMSPTPDNRRLCELGVGILADSRGQWERRLAHLMRHDDARAELAAAGRAAMRAQTYEAQADRWWDAWTS
jgi:glycosyltransferase involved in cell wall biosynthesis